MVVRALHLLTLTGAGSSALPLHQVEALVVAPAAAQRSPAPARQPQSASALVALAPPVQTGSVVAPLRVLALGPLQIYREGELLPAEVWRYARPKELLLYLLSHPEGRTREQIGLLFWPDASAAQVKHSFHVTLHHLRKVLGRSEWVVLENERYRLSPEIEVEFDSARFEQQITAALREVRAGAGSINQLREELDAEPEEETTELYERLRLAAAL